MRPPVSQLLHLAAAIANVGRNEPGAQYDFIYRRGRSACVAVPVQSNTKITTRFLKSTAQVLAIKQIEPMQAPSQ